MVARYPSQEYSPNTRARTIKHQHKVRAKIAAMKVAAGCADCGYNAHSTALQYDHVRGEKDFNISQAPSKAWARVEAEIEKCEVVCANCHAIRTKGRNDG